MHFNKMPQTGILSLLTGWTLRHAKERKLPSSHASQSMVKHGVEDLLYSPNPYLFRAATNSDKIKSAIHFADSCFSGERRRFTPEALITHSIFVGNESGIVIDGLGIDESKRELLLLKSVLHDVLEDSPPDRKDLANKRELNRLFGRACADGVKRLSVPDDHILENIFSKNVKLRELSLNFDDLKNAFKALIQANRLRPDELVAKSADTISKCMSDGVCFITGKMFVGCKKYPDFASVKANIEQRRIYIGIYLEKLSLPQNAAYFGPEKTEVIRKRIQKRFNRESAKMLKQATLSAKRTERPKEVEHLSPQIA